jgi:hypothetical protein
VRRAVTPLLTRTGTFGLQFGAPWSVEPSQSQGSNIAYRVLSPSASIEVQQVGLDGNGFKAGLIGSVVVQETLAAAATTAIPPSPVLVVLDVAMLQAKQGQAAMTGFADWFVVCPPSV